MESILQQMHEPLTKRLLEIIVNANPHHASDEAFLLSYYKRVKATWSHSAIYNLQAKTGLKLTSKLNRCIFAISAAKFELQFMDSEIENNKSYLSQKTLPATSSINLQENPIINSHALDNSSLIKEELVNANELLEIAHQQIEELKAKLQQEQERLQKQQEQLDNQQQQLEQSQNFSALLIANRLLAPGLPLNGTEESPAMRILGSPKTLTELNANYRELIKREHPDVSVFPEEEAVHRFAYVRALYRITLQNWDILKPTAKITTAQLEKRMKAPVPFEPSTFWTN